LKRAARKLGILISMDSAAQRVYGCDVKKTAIDLARLAFQMMYAGVIDPKHEDKILSKTELFQLLDGKNDRKTQVNSRAVTENWVLADNEYVFALTKFVLKEVQSHIIRTN
jgi:hypothetical protein